MPAHPLIHKMCRACNHVGIIKSTSPSRLLTPRNLWCKTITLDVIWHKYKRFGIISASRRRLIIDSMLDRNTDIAAGVNLFNWKLVDDPEKISQIRISL